MKQRIGQQTHGFDDRLMVQGFLCSGRDILLLRCCGEQQPPRQSERQASASSNIGLVRVRHQRWGVRRRGTDSALGHRVRGHVLPGRLPHGHGLGRAAEAAVGHRAWTPICSCSSSGARSLSSFVVPSCLPVCALTFDYCLIFRDIEWSDTAVAHVPSNVGVIHPRAHSVEACRQENSSTALCLHLQLKSSPLLERTLAL
jgi:hypothetical protein